MEPDLEVELVDRLRAGDTTAFDALYDTLNPRLFSFLQRMAKNRAVAEDLLEETWLRLISARHELAPGTRIVPWLFTVARNLFLSYCRSRCREQGYTAELLSLWPDSESPYATAANSQFGQRLEAAIAQLPPTYREVILLVGVEGLKPADAALVCGIEPEALRQRLSRARKQLTQLMQDTR